MAEHNDAPMTREDANMHFAVSYLREDLQGVRQDIRDVNKRIDELTQRMDQRIDELAQRMDQRFNRQTATMLAIAGAIIAAVKM